MRRLRNQVTIAAVSFILGLLVVVQLRAQAAGSGLGAMSSQDLTVFVANLNAGLEQRRQEIAALERDLATLSANQDRGVVSLGQVRDELASIRAYAGLDPVVGPGVTVSVDGPIDGPAVEDLINELRNAGAEAIAIDDVRLIAGSVVTGGPGEVAVEGKRLDDPFQRVRDRRRRDADRVADADRRDRCPGRRHVPRRDPDRHAGDAPRAARHRAGARPGTRRPATLTPSRLLR